MATVKKEIVVKLQVEGVHCWPECPIEEVKYLRDPHRHMFHITCKKTVSHNDRDIEIIQLKHKIRDYLEVKYQKVEVRCLQFGRMSCEDIAEELANKFDLNFVEVLEDGENGASIHRQLDRSN